MRVLYYLRSCGSVHFEYISAWEDCKGYTAFLSLVYGWCLFFEFRKFCLACFKSLVELIIGANFILFNKPFTDHNKMTDIKLPPLTLSELVRKFRACKTLAEERNVINQEGALIRDSFQDESCKYKHLGVIKLLFF